NPIDMSALSEPARQTYAALQKYHSTVLAAKAVTREQIEVAYLLGNAGLSKYLLAISVGSVFFGANTYTGNGPTSMVKAIADQQTVHTPTFLGYILKYALPYMAPMLVVVWLVFFRRYEPAFKIRLSFSSSSSFSSSIPRFLLPFRDCFL